jgi:hypothetical protein
MIKTRNIFAAFILPGIFLSSCKNELFLQRKYISGTYKSKEYKAEVNSDKIASQKENVRFLSPAADNFSEKREAKVFLLASAEKKIIPAETLSKTLEEKKSGPLCEDTLVFANGKKVPCKVNEIDPILISYISCEAGPTLTYKIFRSEAKYIRYYNGIIESFESENTVSHDPPPLQAPKYTVAQKKKFRGETLGTVGSVLGILGALIITFSAPLAGILTAVTLFALLAFIKNRKSNKDLWKYKLANVPGLLLGILSVGTLFLVVIGIGILLMMGL